MDKAAVDVAGTLARLSELTLFELRGAWRRLHRAPPPMRLSRYLLMRKPDRPKASGIFRCAIYIRKSSDDGLEQEFNSLDAELAAM